MGPSRPTNRCVYAPERKLTRQQALELEASRRHREIAENLAEIAATDKTAVGVRAAIIFDRLHGRPREAADAEETTQDDLAWRLLEIPAEGRQALAVELRRIRDLPERDAQP